MIMKRRLYRRDHAQRTSTRDVRRRPYEDEHRVRATPGVQALRHDATMQKNTTYETRYFSRFSSHTILSLPVLHAARS